MRVSVCQVTPRTLATAPAAEPKFFACRVILKPLRGGLVAEAANNRKRAQKNAKTACEARRFVEFKLSRNLGSPRQLFGGVFFTEHHLFGKFAPQRALDNTGHVFSEPRFEHRPQKFGDRFFHRSHVTFGMMHGDGRR